ncbi:hypothetical protein BpHYR1_044715, partial [Brachionus plicatilis]
MYLANQAKKTLRPQGKDATPSPKRKRVVSDFVQKEQIIEKMNLGYSYEKVAADYNIGVSTEHQISDLIISRNFFSFIFTLFVPNKVSK